jgi:hypothetical protein
MSADTRELLAEIERLNEESLHNCRMAKKWMDQALDAEAKLAAAEAAKNGAYSERNKLVALLASLFPSSMERHEGAEWEDDWRWVVFIDLPTGQVSWHIHDSELPLFGHVKSQGARTWDGHTNGEKWARVRRAAGQPLQGVQQLAAPSPQSAESPLSASSEVPTDSGESVRSPDKGEPACEHCICTCVDCSSCGCGVSP